MFDDDYQKLKDHALRLLSFRPRSKKEISVRLKRFAVKRNIQEKLTDKLLEELYDLRLLNDEEFAKWWVEQRSTSNPKGKIATKSELLGKGVENEIIEKVLKEQGRGFYDDQFNLALRVITKKESLLKNLQSDKLKVKVASLLSRRGFTWETIYKVVDSLVKKS